MRNIKQAIAFLATVMITAVSYCDTEPKYAPHGVIGGLVPTMTNTEEWARDSFVANTGGTVKGGLILSKDSGVKLQIGDAGTTSTNQLQIDSNGMFNSSGGQYSFRANNSASNQSVLTPNGSPVLTKNLADTLYAPIGGGGGGGITTNAVKDIIAATPLVQTNSLGIIKDAKITAAQIVDVDVPGLCFIAEETNSVVSMSKTGTAPDISLEYTLDGKNWNTFVTNYTVTPIVLANIGDRAWIRAVDVNNAISTSYDKYWRFVLTGMLSSEGSIEFMRTKDGVLSSMPDYCYSFLFMGCSSLTKAPTLPATTLGYRCYREMFKGCTSLTKAPILPAKILTASCYESMFEGCVGLVSAPELPATTLADSCYIGMFSDCTSITKAPVLKATNLEAYCYRSMFYGCTELTDAPELVAMTMKNSCYGSMFEGCTSLTKPPKLPATTLADHCYYHMFFGCTSLTEAPELPAKALADGCYNSMFFECRKLKLSKTATGEYVQQYRIPSYGNAVSAGDYSLISMFSFTGGTFTGTPKTNVTYYVTWDSSPYVTSNMVNRMIASVAVTNAIAGITTNGVPVVLDADKIAHIVFPEGGGPTSGVTRAESTNIAHSVVSQDVAGWAMKGQPKPATDLSSITNLVVDSSLASTNYTDSATNAVMICASRMGAPDWDQYTRYSIGDFAWYQGSQWTPEDTGLYVAKRAVYNNPPPYSTNDWQRMSNANELFGPWNARLSSQYLRQCQNGIGFENGAILWEGNAITIANGYLKLGAAQILVGRNTGEYYSLDQYLSDGYWNTSASYNNRFARIGDIFSSSITNAGAVEASVAYTKQYVSENADYELSTLPLITNIVGGVKSVDCNISSGVIGDISTGGDISELGITLNFADTANRSGDCMIYIVNASPLDMVVKPADKVLPIGWDGEPIPAGTNVVSFTRVKRDGSKSLILIKTKEIE